jgi:hypothetical protein
MLPAALAQPAPPAAAPLPHHYVFVLDTSFSMNRIAQATRATLRGLIADGVQERMQPGDQFELWTFDEQTYTQRYPVQTWTAESSQELAARAFVFLNRQRWEKQGRPNTALAELNRAVQQAPTLTAIILTDGEDRMRGTPFDAELNAVLRQRRRELRQAKLPFLVALQARTGRFTAWAVNTPSELIKLPQLDLAAQPARDRAAGAATHPQLPQPAEFKAPPLQPLPQPSAPPAPVPAQAGTESQLGRQNLPAPTKVAPTAPLPAAPRELADSAATEATPAKALPAPPPPPKPVPPSEPAPAPQPSPTKPAREADSAPPLPATPAQPVATAKEPQRPPAQDAGAGPAAAPQLAKAPLEPSPGPKPAPPPPESRKDGVKDTPGSTATSPPAEPAPPRVTLTHARETVEPKPAAPGSGPRPAVPPVPREAKQTKPVVRTASIQKRAAATARPAHQEAAKPPLQQTALITPEPSPPERWLHLGLGAALLALGSWLSYWFVRHRRPTRQPSLISQSLERRQSKAGKRTVR